MMKEFKTATDGAGITSATRKPHFLRTMLHGEALKRFNFLAGQVGSTTNGYLNLIKEILLGYFPPINTLTKQKLAIRRAMQKPQDLLFKIFSARLMELKNYLTFFPGTSAAKKIDPE